MNGWKRIWMWAPVAGLAAGLAACTPPARSADVEAEALVIRDISAGWLEHRRARDAKAIADLFASDAVTLFDGQKNEGPAEILTRTEREFAEYPDATASWSTTQMQVAGSGDLAYERGTWRFDPDGAGPLPEDHGEYVTVYRKVDGKWKVVADVGTSLRRRE